VVIEGAGHVVMISGANRGIGKSIANALYSAGYDLSLGARDVTSLEKAFPEFDEKRVLHHSFEATNRDTHVSWIEATANKFGRLDGLVNNAGIMRSVSMSDEVYDESALDLMWTVNVKAPLSLTKLALPHLRQSGSGRVVNVASLAGKAVYGSAVGYSMTKFAAVALSHATRHAGWDDGVRCTAICPGYVATDMTSAVESMELKDMISADDLAQLVVTIMQLSNTASVAELVVNCRPDIVA
jgi:NADP-dependent 3-hydroxy acid dehydrogenase YdfG